MGAWGINTFENDGALDWLGDFLDDPTEAKILEAFSASPTVIQPSLIGRLMGKKAQVCPAELDGEVVLAAAEVIALMSGRPAHSIPDELRNLPRLSLRPETPTRALAAIDAILGNSNLKDCWEETADFDNWKESVQDLRKRLSNQ